jgi:Tfp pilus assembly protein PilF
VALAELYKALGLRRRAEGELQRALTVDPKNAAARTLLASLKH